jgi:hypothetical protein
MGGASGWSKEWIEPISATRVQYICLLGHYLKRANERTFSGWIPGLVPPDGGDRTWGNVGKKRRAMNVSGEGVG